MLPFKIIINQFFSKEYVISVLYLIVPTQPHRGHGIPLCCFKVPCAWVFQFASVTGKKYMQILLFCIITVLFAALGRLYSTSYICANFQTLKDLYN